MRRLLPGLPSGGSAFLMAAWLSAGLLSAWALWPRWVDRLYAGKETAADRAAYARFLESLVDRKETPDPAGLLRMAAHQHLLLGMEEWRELPWVLVAPPEAWVLERVRPAEVREALRIYGKLQALRPGDAEAGRIVRLLQERLGRVAQD